MTSKCQPYSQHHFQGLVCFCVPKLALRLRNTQPITSLGNFPSFPWSLTGVWCRCTGRRGHRRQRVRRGIDDIIWCHSNEGRWRGDGERFRLHWRGRRSVNKIQFQCLISHIPQIPGVSVLSKRLRNLPTRQKWVDVCNSNTLWCNDDIIE